MKYLNLIILLLFLLACQDKKKDEIKHLVSEWQGKEIRFPKDMVFARFATDTVDFTLPKSPHKVLVFVDSIGCTSCKLQLHRWKELIQYTDSITQGTVQSDRLNELNHFPADGRFQTFLLDKDNKVVVIGNPIHNPNIRELYLKEITGKQPASQIQTTVKVEEASIQLGTIQMGESKEAVFRLTNTGNNPLVILDAATTCGCARPSFDKHPAKPGEILQVRVIMTPKDKGVFDETISVKCNTNQLIKLNIRGMAQ